jgi:hypothetical protein
MFIDILQKMKGRTAKICSSNFIVDRKICLQPREQRKPRRRRRTVRQYV